MLHSRAHPPSGLEASDGPQPSARLLPVGCLRLGTARVIGAVPMHSMVPAWFSFPQRQVRIHFLMSPLREENAGKLALFHQFASSPETSQSQQLSGLSALPAAEKLTAERQALPGSSPSTLPLRQGTQGCATRLRGGRCHRRQQPLLRARLLHDWQGDSSSCRLQVVSLKKAALFNPKRAGAASGFDVSACWFVSDDKSMQRRSCTPGTRPHTRRGMCTRGQSRTREGHGALVRRQSPWETGGGIPGGLWNAPAAG